MAFRSHLIDPPIFICYKVKVWWLSRVILILSHSKKRRHCHQNSPFLCFLRQVLILSCLSVNSQIKHLLSCCTLALRRLFSQGGQKPALLVTTMQRLTQSQYRWDHKGQVRGRYVTLVVTGNTGTWTEVEADGDQELQQTKPENPKVIIEDTTSRFMWQKSKPDYYRWHTYVSDRII